MKVALTVNDFLRRAELVYPKRIGIVDEPDQPAESWGTLTYAQVAQRARAIAAGRGPRPSANAATVSAARLTASNGTSVPGMLASSAIRLLRAAGLAGRKPAK